MFKKKDKEIADLKRRLEFKRAKETKAIDILTSDINPYTKLRDLKELYRDEIYYRR